MRLNGILFFNFELLMARVWIVLLQELNDAFRQFAL